jgi:ABC-type multidrug transport system permease subunit
MNKFTSQLIRNTLALIFAILFIAFIKVFFGGDISLVNVKTIGVALLYIVPSSFVIALGVGLYESRKQKADQNNGL